MTINIILASDNKGFDMMTVVAYSVIKNNPGRSLHFYVIHSDISAENIRRIKRFGEKFADVLVSIISVDEKLFKDIDLTNKAVSMPAYYRYLAPEVLPREEHRALYMDFDMLCLDSLDELYTTDLGSKYIGAVADYWISKKDGYWSRIRTGIGFKQNEKYINSGLLLLDLDKLRSGKIMETFWYNIRNKNKIIPAEFNVLADQTVTNITFKGKIKFLDPKYNVFTTALAHTKHKDPTIVHFTGSYKPLTYRDQYMAFYDELYHTYYRECMNIIGDDGDLLIKNTLVKLSQEAKDALQELNPKLNEISRLTARLSDREQEIALLHRQQRDVRFLAKRLAAETKTRLNKRAKSVIVTNHLRYNQDNQIDKLLKSDTKKDILVEIHRLDTQNIHHGKVNPIDQLKPLAWKVASSTFDTSIRVLRKVRHGK